MPIVSEEVCGLRRYAVFSFVEDVDAHNNNNPEGKKPVSGFLRCPLTSPMEAASKLAQTELFHMKRLVSLEKGVLCPYVDITFFTSFEGVVQVRGLVGRKDCINLHDPSIKLQKALYEELQLVDPKRDMINTPIDADDPIGELQSGRGIKSWKSSSASSPDGSKKLRGYIIIAYKTMEDMYNRDFVKSWKTWTGVRYICMQLPRQLGLRRISFYRQLSKTSSFQYVLCIEISNLLVYAAETLNLMDRIKLRLCGNVGVYRETDFQLDPATASNLNLPSDFTPPTSILQDDNPKINISRYSSREKSIDENSNEDVSLPGTPLRRKDKDHLTKVKKLAAAEERRGSKESLTEAESPKKEAKPPPTKKPLKRLERQKSEERKPPKPTPRESKNHHKDRKVEESPKETSTSHQKESKNRKHPPESQELPSLPSTESITSTDTNLTPINSKQQPKSEMAKRKEEHRIDIEQPREGNGKSVEAEVHPRSAPKPSRFVGQGRICNSSGIVSRSPSQFRAGSSDDLVTDLPSRHDSMSTTDTSTPSMLTQIRRQSLLNNSGDPVKLPYSGYLYSHKRVQPRASDGSTQRLHNVVSDLPSARETLKPAYESIFKRGDTPPFPDFATIAARAKTRSYNSPVFSRDEWKKESPVYRGKSRGDQAIHVLADQLNISSETQGLKSRNFEDELERQPLITKEEEAVLTAASIIEAKLRKRSSSLNNKDRDPASRRSRILSQEVDTQDIINGNTKGHQLRFNLGNEDDEEDYRTSLQHRRSIATEREVRGEIPSRKHHSLHLDPAESHAFRHVFAARSPPATSPSKPRSFFPLPVSPKTSDDDRLSAPRGPKKKSRPISPNPSLESIGAKYRSRSTSRKQKSRKHNLY